MPFRTQPHYLFVVVVVFSCTVIFSVCCCCFNRKSEEEVDMDKVTAAMVLTSLSSSPLVRSPPVKVSGESTKHVFIYLSFFYTGDHTEIKKLCYKGVLSQDGNNPTFDRANSCLRASV